MKKIFIIICLVLFLPAFLYAQDIYPYTDVNNYIDEAVNEIIRDHSFDDFEDVRMEISIEIAASMQAIKNQGIIELYSISIVDKKKLDVDILVMYKIRNSKIVHSYVIHIEGDLPPDKRKIKV